ncbi:hypothetical protein BO71DRAFT_485536 [Aspergillus ellipticus CBS 707.79]|uniref:F-box domain-containing protein n=1 Tax=Aspergillus ellipticus CBS 707.79 TaxID=1448320 RepID=A0A319D4R0_9EURO|nr:hypothetical protein BO71DRAFT_485536 [Aspergillus ellipticus CBS 707.79]
MEKEKTGNKLEQLPMDLIQVILASIPDISSLKSAILTEKHLYTAFLGDEKLITQTVLRNQIGKEMLHDALAAMLSFGYKNASMQQKLDFSVNCIARRRRAFDFLMPCKLSQALPLAQFHDTIGVLRTDFTKEILSYHPVLQEYDEDPPLRPLSETERDRITRVFYRFQIFINLYNERALFPLARQYLQYFPPWEVEQAVCIHTYVSRVVKEVFDRISYSDPNWEGIVGESMIKLCQMSQVSKGLHHVRKLLESDTLESRRDLFAPDRSRDWKETFFGTDSLDTGLGRLDAALSVERQIERFTGRSPGTEEGPVEIWTWIQCTRIHPEWHYPNINRWLRRWAIMLWDQQRLETWGVFAIVGEILIHLTDYQCCVGYESYFDDGKVDYVFAR